jgi:hypothetical protein
VLSFAALSTRQNRLELRVSEYFKDDYDARQHWACPFCTPFALSLLCIAFIVISCLRGGAGRAGGWTLYQRLKPALLNRRFVAAEVLVLLSISFDIARWL